MISVGFDVYCNLLEDAIKDLQDEYDYHKKREDDNNREQENILNTVQNNYNRIQEIKDELSRADAKQYDLTDEFENLYDESIELYNSSLNKQYKNQEVKNKIEEFITLTKNLLDEYNRLKTNYQNERQELKEIHDQLINQQPALEMLRNTIDKLNEQDPIPKIVDDIRIIKNTLRG